jgi:hypothetical protein
MNSGELRPVQDDKTAVRHLYRGCVSINELSGPGTQRPMLPALIRAALVPGHPRKVHVALPEEPPDVTQCVAVALLHLLRVLIADPSRPRPEAGEH